MKVTMIRKASNQANWNDDYEALKMQGMADQDEVAIEKSITIPLEEYEKMLGSLLQDSRHITENLKFMRKDSADVWHCLKLTASGSKTSLLVESEGYDYPRYTSIINKK